MGNSESSSSFPSHWGSNDPDQSKKKESKEETSAAGAAIKVGAAAAGTALLALGAWSLSSSSDSTENKAQKKESKEETSAAGAAAAGAALLALGAWSLSSSSDSTENKAQKMSTVNRSGLGGSNSFISSSGSASFRPEGLSGNNSYDKPSSRLIRIMSYNVWFREDVEVIRRMGAIGQLIQQHSPDVIFFQEVTPYIYSIFQSSQWWKLYKCSVPPERASSRRYFCMLLSKLPVKRFINKGFENSTMGREVCVAELDVGPNNSLLVANSHLESPTPPEMNSTKRVAQAKEGLRHLSSLPNVIFGGDMNWCEITDGPFPLHGAWMDAWTECRPEENGWTYDTKANQSLRGYRPVQERLDRFICKLRDFEIIGINMIGMEAIPGFSYRHKNKVNPVYPSDHFGLLLTLKII